jgi:hypothetical protein
MPDDDPSVLIGICVPHGEIAWLIPDEMIVANGVAGEGTQTMRPSAFVTVVVAAVFLAGLASPAAFARDISVRSFGPGDAAWNNYYANPSDQATWSPFCQGGGASLVTSVQGVPACGPTPSSGGVHIFLPENGGPVVGFQCVELVERYLYVNYGWKPINQTNGAQVVKNYASQDKVSFTVNDTAGQVPAVGDVMSFSATPQFTDIGHTAIVSKSSVNSSGDGSVIVVGENQNTVKGYNGFTAGSATMKVTGWKIQTFDGTNKYIEWLNNVSAEPSWSIQSTPSPGTFPWLSGVACTSSVSCTAVGNYNNSSGITVTLVERWNGSTWTVEASPNPPGSYSSWFDGISCPAATSCTAVGGYENSSGTQFTLAEHWNGSTWAIQSTPNPTGSPLSELDAVSCAATNSCTAVGGYQDSSGEDMMMAEQWNGSTWAIKTTPAPSGTTISFLYGVSCATPTSCAAVGIHEPNIYNVSTLAEHWNGSAWAIQSTVNPSGGGSLDTVSCAATNSCTALGGGNSELLAEHWDGSTWAVQSIPNPSGSPSSGFKDISCTTATSCTAVGYYLANSTTGTQLTFAENWNGSTWAAQVTPNPASTGSSELWGISCVAVADCTAVGGYANSSYTAQTTLAESN